MKTYLIIWEETPEEGDYPLYIAPNRAIESSPPMVGDLIQIKEPGPAEPGRPYRRKEWPVTATFRVTGRSYVIHREQGHDDDMTCELTVERIP